ncbi:hypothetical protein SAMN04487981_114197 [Streptomyces sp. cf386]|uniref:hypothetical protein n=1 Tax=Streptomyces sp. cf386 TaxID=1761904 RepID=UPI0008853786|nr:hypothetical protein [Streptomyces sp. cf386]SDO91641.1 hypothetical protein SAMN04487981_114197 [Streptomyces sp. cf386]
MSKWNAEWFTVPGAAVFDSSAQVASVSRAEDHLDLFVVGYDNHVWTQNWSAGAGWHPDWGPVPGAAVFDQQPVAAVSRDKDHLDLFLIGNDNHIWSTFWSAGGGWSRDWFPVPGQAVFDQKQRPAGVSRRGDHLDLFVVGYDNHVWSTYWHHRALHFRLRYFVEKESTDDFLQGASDEVYMSALGVDSSLVGARPDGTYGAHIAQGQEIGDVSEDGMRDPWRDSPHVLMEFALDRPGHWPRSYTTTLLVIEHDNGDLKGEFGSLYDAFGKAIRTSVVAAATAAGASLTGPVIAAAIGDLAGSAFDALNNKVRSGLTDESFTPIPITIVVDDPEHFARHPQVGRQLTQRVEQFGGVYEVLYEWHVS